MLPTGSGKTFLGLQAIADAGVSDSLQPEEGFPAARGEHDAPSPPVVDPGVEGGLLVVTRFDVERRRKLQVGVGPSSILAGPTESIAERGLVVAARLCAGPFGEGSISICLCAMLVDAVVPLRVGHILGRVTE